MLRKVYLRKTAVGVKAALSLRGKAKAPVLKQLVYFLLQKADGFAGGVCIGGLRRVGGCGCTGIIVFILLWWLLGNFGIFQ